MTSSSTNSGFATITVTFDVTPRPGPGRGRRAEPRRRRRSAACRPRCARNGVTVTKNTTGFVLAAGVYAEKGEYDSLFISNYIDVYVSDALKRVPGVGDVIDLRRAQVRDAAVARSGAAGGAADHRRRRRQRAARAERAGRGRRGRRGAGADGPDLPDQRARDGPPDRGAPSSRTSSSRPAPTARWSG